jgi:hypothetical protein
MICLKTILNKKELLINKINLIIPQIIKFEMYKNNKFISLSIIQVIKGKIIKLNI